MRGHWPDAEDLLLLLADSTASRTIVRDGGILFASAARPHAHLLQGLVYPTPLDQAAALLHGILVWRPLDMWNASLAWTAADVLLERFGFVLSMPAKDRMALTDALTSGEVDSVEELALRLSPYLEMSD
ncbi:MULTISPECIES: hypothetical protein [Micromonospora]|uniref:Death on curing protein n=1 Tax=Micromonospora solifontis TaxID=2487138 RepID=A0ABX9WCY1_9ACTN|nr:MULTISPECIES: hypothetical protein [Micromonospora]NES16236.1 hypothetical protein [Micromonospora sp. PPF5-17B]NES38109.1 hypothetical protein [Micromonospora solifontis]NES57845.1 hypothetical protein [Micromonospora sp. PPF5-6]RNL97045.1 hypothetical protein EFE23_18425 [Micromonospora solifontis]